MKKLMIINCLIFLGGYLYAQEHIEIVIRNLEQAEVQAILAKDTITLKKLWDKGYIVNNPDNKIVLAQSNSVNRPVLQTARISFTREVEQIFVNGDVVISMGSEAVEDTAKPGQPVKRRYTHIWTKKEGVWKLIARHANRICP